MLFGDRTRWLLWAQQDLFDLSRISAGSQQGSEDPCPRTQILKLAEFTWTHCAALGHLLPHWALSSSLTISGCWSVCPWDLHSAWQIHTVARGCLSSKEPSSLSLPCLLPLLVLHSDHWQHGICWCILNASCSSYLCHLAEMFPLA